MSRRSGIAKEYIINNYKDIYPADRVVLPNKKLIAPPRFYDNYLELNHIKYYDIIKTKRKMKLLDTDFADMLQRLEGKKKAQIEAFKLLKRNLENTL